MRYGRIITVAILILLAATLVALPQRGKGWQHRGPGGEGLELGIGEFFHAGRGMFIPPNRVLENVLGLDAEQLQEVDALRDAVKEQVAPLAESLRANGQALRAELEVEDANATSVGELVIRMRDTRHAIRGIHEEGRAAFEAILTEEQLAALDEYRERGPRRRGPRGRGSGNN